MGLHQNDSLITDRNAVLRFGRYKGLTIGEVLKDDPAYLVWAAENVDGFDLHHELLSEAELDHPDIWEQMSGYHWRKEDGT